MDKIYKEIQLGAQFRNLKIVELGRIVSDPLLFLTPSDFKLNMPTLLIAAGFHGEEQGGVEGLLEFLFHGDDSLFKKANLSFLPAVNVSGLRRGDRFNYLKENPNRGFSPAELNQPPLSIEGKILLEKISIIRTSSRDGFLSLHEDDNTEDSSFYIFTYEPSEDPSLFSKTLLQAGLKFFPQTQDGYVEGSIMKNGIVFNDYDGSFEDRLFRDGVPLTACTETPIHNVPIEVRARANRTIVEEFIKFFTTRCGII